MKTRALSAPGGAMGRAPERRRQVAKTLAIPARRQPNKSNRGWGEHTERDMTVNQVHLEIYIPEAGNDFRRTLHPPSQRTCWNFTPNCRETVPPSPTPHDVAAARNVCARTQHTKQATKVRGTPLQRCSGDCAEPGWRAYSHGAQNAHRRVFDLSEARKALSGAMGCQPSSKSRFGSLDFRVREASSHTPPRARHPAAADTVSHM